MLMEVLCVIITGLKWLSDSDSQLCTKHGITLCLAVLTSDQRPYAALLWRRILLLYSKQFSLPLKSVYVKVDDKI